MNSHKPSVVNSQKGFLTLVELVYTIHINGLAIRQAPYILHMHTHNDVPLRNRLPYNTLTNCLQWTPKSTKISRCKIIKNKSQKKSSEKKSPDQKSPEKWSPEKRPGNKGPREKKSPVKQAPHARFPQFGVCGMVGWASFGVWGRRMRSVDENKKILQLSSVNFPVISLSENVFSPTLLPVTIFRGSFFTFFPRTIKNTIYLKIVKHRYRLKK